MKTKFTTEEIEYKNERFHEIKKSLEKEYDSTLTLKVALSKASMVYNTNEKWLQFNSQIVDNRPVLYPEVTITSLDGKATSQNKTNVSDEATEDNSIANESSVTQDEREEVSVEEEKENDSVQRHSNSVENGSDDESSTSSNQNTSTNSVEHESDEEIHTSSSQTTSTNDQPNAGKRKSSSYRIQLKNPKCSKRSKKGEITLFSPSSDNLSKKISTKKCTSRNPPESKSKQGTIGRSYGRVVKDIEKDIEYIVARTYCNVCDDNACRRVNTVGSLFHICLSCQKDNTIDIKKLHKLVQTRRNHSNCITCGTNLNSGKFHQMGKLRFCRACVSYKTCLCDVCSSLKSTYKSNLCKFWGRTTNTANLIFDDDATSYNQVMKFLANRSPNIELKKSIASLSKYFEHEDQTILVKIHNMKLKSTDLAKFGKMRATNSKNSKKSNYVWEPCTSHKREFSFDVMKYFGFMWQNKVTKNVGTFKDLVDGLNSFENFVREEQNIFGYSFVFMLVYHQEKDWLSIVIDLTDREIHTFNMNSQLTKTVEITVDHVMEEKLKTMDEADLKHYGQEKLWSSKLYDPFQPSLEIYTHEEHKFDIPTVCVLHVWLFTMEEWKGFGINRYGWQKIVNKNNIERFRELLLAFVLSGNPNLLLFYDMNLVQ